MSTRARVTAGYGAAAVLVVAGWVLARTAKQVTEFGWFAYAPLAPENPFPHLTLWSWRRIGAALLVVVGLLVAATTTGWLLGRRSAASVGRSPLRVAAALGVALVALGVAIFTIAAGDRDPTTVSITPAPTHLSSVLVPGWVWTRSQLAGAALTLVGLLLAAAALGLRRGGRLRQPGRSPAGPPPAPAGL